MNIRKLKALMPWKFRRGLFRKLILIKDLPERLSFRKRLYQATPVLILQPGKVGSSSITRSLQKYYKGAVIHCHSFRPDYPINWRVPKLYQYWSANAGPVKLITPVREPVSRNVSAFFFNKGLKNQLPVFHKTEQAIEDLQQDFMKNFAQDKTKRWFDNQLKGIFGIDVFAETFPTEKGYRIYKNGSAELLVMQIELTDEEKAQLIRDFLEMEQFTLIRKNVGSGRMYSELYNAFKRKKLPAHVVESFLAGAFFQHFYNHEMAERVRKKWVQEG